jgi:hypothetical protein
VLEIELPSNNNNQEPSISCISDLDNKVIPLTPIQRSANVYEVPWQPFASGKYTIKICTLHYLMGKKLIMHKNSRTC